MKTKLFLLLVILIIIPISGCVQVIEYKPVCGNGVIEEGETRESCCEDVGCLGEQTCQNHRCVDPVCGECQYLENHRCEDYPCCSYSDCDDHDPSTDDECINPSSKNAQCKNTIIEESNSVTIFVDKDTYESLKYEIDRFRNDISSDLDTHVFLFSGNWSDIAIIKGMLIDKYENNGLIGTILIGDIPTAYFEYQDQFNVLSDWYFQDLSDKFIDDDGDGMFEREHYMSGTDVTMRDIWSGRIKPPVGGSEGIELLRNYFDRNHAYRTGSLEYDERMLYFGSIAINERGISKENYTLLVNQIDEFTGLYDSDNQIDYFYDLDPEVQKSEYLSKLSNNNYDFVFLNIHGTPTSQWVGGSTDVNFSEIKHANPQALFTDLASCSNGDFTEENYFAGWYLFSGKSLVVMANSVVAMLVGGESVEFLEPYIPLGLGVTFGEMHKNDGSFLVGHLFGDPTLSFRPKPIGDLPRLSLNATDLDFGISQRGSKPKIYVLFKNEGGETLEIRFKYAASSINDEDSYLEYGIEYWNFFYYELPDVIGEGFLDFEIEPSQNKSIPFIFYPRADGPTGKYSMTMLFQTNDPDNPYVRINLVGNAI